MIDPQAIVRIQNEGTEPFYGGYDNRPFVIQPGKEIATFAEAAVIFCGNWETRNVGTDRKRWAEHQRLIAMYGVLAGSKTWDERPKLAVFDQEGNRIATVLEDPEGHNLAEVVTGTDDELRERRMVALERELMRLREELNESKQDDRPLEPDDPDAEAPRRRRRQEAEVTA